MHSDCLIEIGTEELPPRALRSLSQNFGAIMQRALVEHDLAPGALEVFATPRRLAVLFRDTPTRQPDQVIEKRGPALAAAFDDDGNPSRAALGFAGSCGVEVGQLERRETDKGSWLYFCSTQAGKSLQELLPQLLVTALAELPIPKRMRWGDRSDEFVRPVKWLLLMIDNEVVDTELFGLRSGNRSFGHRFHAPTSLEIASPGEYEETLLSQGMVIASFEQRRDAIRKLVEEAAARVGGSAHIEDDLLNEVTGLVEYPVAVCGQFDPEFLELPVEVLVTTMQENQKYFALFDDDGALLPHFVAISNIDSRKPEVVAGGNERVIRPRFADAGFFFAQDQKQGLDVMRFRLDSVVFQEKLGSLGDKTARIIRLAKYIASHSGADQDLVRRAADLCKADLMSDMVGEFPKLQGVMGRYYAQLQQEEQSVCDAIEQHYWPRHAGDRLPQGPIAQALALADRLDSLIGIFGIGEKPGGDKDPFALRRAALGVLRIIVENRLTLDLRDLCQAAADGYHKQIDAAAVIDEVIDYVFDRLRAYYQEQGIGFDIVDAVAYSRPGQLYDCDLRIRALLEFQSHEAALALAAANKRIGNILKKQDKIADTVDRSLLLESAETQLYEQLLERADSVRQQFAQGEYLQGLERLAELRPAVDLFFDEVMVMVDDEALKNNRLALLDQLLQSFRLVADFSRIQS
ncbi:MAG: glycine--tRNA ligase subunit beta [Gammaproteobacteria bacterium]|jgi:glycyl-tRNA synthetase beta chain|nr:glycine--tRNA ligase subunit beta [Gammaproteobacteria bacterium]